MTGTIEFWMKMSYGVLDEIKKNTHTDLTLWFKVKSRDT